jgi:coproporphyrinogen III oxidase-like Fe-S oxidoreductase
MLNQIIEETTIYSLKKIINHSMNKSLDIQFIDDTTRHNVNKNKSYLLYIHVPFCHTFCPFCSFHKFKYDKKISEDYFKSLRLEMRKVKNEGFSFHTLYVGGGTTLINEKELIKTLELAKNLFDIKDISCESDPNHISPDSLKSFSGLINRLSIGIQSFDDTILKRIHRYDKFGSAKILQEKIASMQGILPSTSLDLIFNFPTQTNEMLIKDLDIAKSLGVEQITTYPLMSSSLTRDRMSKAFDAQQNSSEYSFYNTIKESLSGYYQNNAWSFSKEKSEMSDEYVTNHNEYIGIGSGAFSYINNHLYINAFDLNEYSDLVSKRSNAIVANSSFSFQKRLQYHFLTWLFSGTLDIKKFNYSFGTNLLTSLRKEMFMLKKADAIYIKKGKIYATNFGQYLCLVMMKEFYSGMDKIRSIFKQENLKIAV